MTPFPVIVIYNLDFKIHINKEGGDFMKRNKLIVPGAKEAIENLKYEIAHELGITLGADTTSRLNGTVGGEMTKRLVRLGEQQLEGKR